MNVEKINELYDFIRNTHKTAVLAEHDGSAFIAFQYDDFLEKWPKAEIYLEINDDTCIFVAYDLLTVNPLISEEYFKALKTVNEWNDSYNLLKWSFSEEGVISATYTDHSSFDLESSKYVVLVNRLLTELSEKLDEELFDLSSNELVF